MFSPHGSFACQRRGFLRFLLREKIGTNWFMPAFKEQIRASGKRRRQHNGVFFSEEIEK
jgi:hypothetical protein